MAELNIPEAPAIDGATHVHSGKVRDLYALPDDRLLMVASDRISAFDFVLDTTIPDKGEILTRMSLWWFEQLADLVPNHVLSTEVPVALRGRAVICERLDMSPVECVARGYLTGSGLREYVDTGEVCGIALPPGLLDGSRLESAIFTPATKAELGDHDENVSYEAVVATVGDQTAATLRDLTLAVYRRKRCAGLTSRQCRLRSEVFLNLSPCGCLSQRPNGVVSSTSSTEPGCTPRHRRISCWNRLRPFAEPSRTCAAKLS